MFVRYIGIEDREYGGMKFIIIFKSYLFLYMSYISIVIIDWILNIWIINGFGWLVNYC